VDAQAIAARTYAVAHLDRWAELGFDLYGDVRDQVYGGLSAERGDASRAVQATDAIVVAYEGVLIGAYYSAVCGGMSAAVEETWALPPAPYLRAHPDRLDGADLCRESKHYRWEEKWTGSEFMALLARTMTAEFPGPAPAGELEDVRIAERNSSGRVRVLVVRAGGRDHRLGGERGDRIRWVLRRPGGTILRSTLFDVETIRRGRRVEAVVVRGRGNGHGVGLCQIGALRMATLGYDYTDILAHYYPGTQLVRLRGRGEACGPGGSFAPVARAAGSSGSRRAGKLGWLPPAWLLDAAPASMVRFTSPVVRFERSPSLPVEGLPCRTASPATLIACFARSAPRMSASSSLCDSSSRGKARSLSPSARLAIASTR